MTRLLAIDPGPEMSQWLVYDLRERRPTAWAHESNELVLRRLDSISANRMAIESVESFGMAVGKETFETAYWVGRFDERWRNMHSRSIPVRVFRSTVKSHLCHSQKATDTNVRRALIDLHGPTEAVVVGRKTCPGVLYGISKHAWSALAVAVTVADTRIMEAAA